MIEIGLCTDDSYAMACGVCITSIFESNTNNKIRIHILTNGLSEDSIERFNQTALKHNQLLEIHKIDDEILTNLPQFKWYTSMIYARLLFSRVLSNDIPKILYFDCDIIVIADLKELWDHDVTQLSCLGIPSINSDDIRLQNRIELFGNTYVNSGVLLMNLDKWRDNNIGDKCIKYITANPDICLLPDQDAINVVLGNQMGYLPFKFNVVISKFDVEYKTLFLRKSRWEELKEARRSPVVIHYVSEVKPWHKEYNHPTQKYFINTLKKSLWKEYKLQHKYKGIDLLKYHIISILKSIYNKHYRTN